MNALPASTLLSTTVSAILTVAPTTLYTELDTVLMPIKLMLSFTISLVPLFRSNTVSLDVMLSTVIPSTLTIPSISSSDKYESTSLSLNLMSLTSMSLLLLFMLTTFSALFPLNSTFFISMSSATMPAIFNTAKSALLSMSLSVPSTSNFDPLIIMIDDLVALFTSTTLLSLSLISTSPTTLSVAPLVATTAAPTSALFPSISLLDDILNVALSI